MDLDRFRHYTAWHARVDERSFEAPADPWRLLSVDPEEITRGNHEKRLVGLGRVDGGDWDREENWYPLVELPFVRGLEQRFEEGRDWEETVLYEWARSRFEDGDAVRGYEDLATFRERRCPYLDDLVAGPAGRR